ncbi:MAG: putative Ig domain-containing protein [Candidatus Marinimicrobia bacterium]|nr:putative Ig domain-containing protein [Candidatus Neomarinimicrobiota bacterium]
MPGYCKYLAIRPFYIIFCKMNIKGITSCVTTGKFLLWLLPVIIFISCDLFNPNTPPQITSSPVTEVNENAEYEYLVQTEDVDGDDISYSLTIFPDWLHLSGNRIHGTAPVVNFDKTYAVTIQASDGKDIDEQSYVITVKNVPDPENTPPEITSEPVTDVDENSYYEYSMTAEDADDDNLTYSLAEGPSWLSIYRNRIRGTAPEVSQDSSVSITARVSDGKDCGEQSYNLIIRQVPDPDRIPKPGVGRRY